VRWFDESYDEPQILLDVRRLAGHSALVVIAGTSAQITLPWQVVALAVRAGETRLTSTGTTTGPATSQQARAV
jgi:hypothetical protein